MSFFGRKKEEPVVNEIETDVWSCGNSECNGWQRKDFSFAENPSCSFCDSAMISEVRILPEINTDFVYTR